MGVPRCDAETEKTTKIRRRGPFREIPPRQAATHDTSDVGLRSGRSSREPISPLFGDPPRPAWARVFLALALWFPWRPSFLRSDRCRVERRRTGRYSVAKRIYHWPRSLKALRQSAAIIELGKPASSLRQRRKKRVGSARSESARPWGPVKSSR